MVKDLVDLKSVLNGNFNWVGRAQRIQLERLLDTFGLKTVNILNMSIFFKHRKHTTN